MATDEYLIESPGVRGLQTVLHAKAKEEPGKRFHALIDKVWREDFLREAYRQVRRNGGKAGVDGESFEDIESYGVERWLGELSQELRKGRYVPQAVREVLIPKRERGKSRPLGIPCIRDRVLQAAAMLVLSPIFEADLPDEQYGYRAGRSAQDAVKRVHRLINLGYNGVVDADLSNFFGEIPHAGLMKSVARRVSDGRMLALIKAWLEMPVERRDDKGRKVRTNRARRERKGTPQGAPISPLLSNICMRRFIVGWKKLGYAFRFNAHIVNYADDFCVLGKVPAQQMLDAVVRIMEHLKLPVNMQKTRCLRCPQEPLEFLGYRIGFNYRYNGKRSYIGTRPLQASVGSLCRRVSELTDCRYQGVEIEAMVGRLNRITTGWANYYCLGQVSPAYHAIDRHTTRRLRQWLCRKHKVKSGKYVRFPDEKLWETHGLRRLAPKTKGFPWAKA